MINNNWCTYNSSKNNNVNNWQENNPFAIPLNISSEWLNWFLNFGIFCSAKAEKRLHFFEKGFFSFISQIIALVRLFQTIIFTSFAPDKCIHFFKKRFFRFSSQRSFASGLLCCAKAKEWFQFFQKRFLDLISLGIFNYIFLFFLCFQLFF